MNCPYCSNPVPEGAAFCGNCGAKMDALPAPAAPPVEPAPDSEPVAAYSAPPPAEPAPVFSPPESPVYTPPAPGVAPKKSNRNTIIIVVVVLVLLCCCCLALVAVMQLGPIISAFGSQTGSYYPFGTPTIRK